jgi:RNA polymerase sigma-70 factor (ECF subfamily)
MDEAALILAACQGDLDAFNRLVLAYQDILYNQAYRIMGDKDSAEDATQDAFISAFRHLSTYRGGSFKAWLLRIVTNICYDELRRRKRRPTSPLEPLDDNQEEIESPIWLSDPGETPEETTERIELSNAIQLCLGNLPIEFREVVILVDIQEMDYAEAASVIRSPVGTVKSRLARARVRMRDCLQDYRELLPASIRLMGESEV